MRTFDLVISEQIAEEIAQKPASSEAEGQERSAYSIVDPAKERSRQMEMKVSELLTAGMDTERMPTSLRPDPIF